MFPDAGFVPIHDLTAAADGRWRCRLDERSRCFEGHFDGAPILPAIAHLALALEACAAAGRGGVLAGVHDFRLNHPLGPGEEVEVACADGATPGSVRFEVRAQGRPASTGTLLFAGGAHG